MKSMKNCNGFDNSVNATAGSMARRALIAETLIANALDGGDCTAALLATESRRRDANNAVAVALVRVHPRQSAANSAVAVSAVSVASVFAVAVELLHVLRVFFMLFMFKAVKELVAKRDPEKHPPSIARHHPK